MDEPLTELGEGIRQELAGWGSDHLQGWLAPEVADPGPDLEELASLETAVVSLLGEELEVIGLFEWLTTGFVPPSLGMAGGPGGAEAGPPAPAPARGTPGAFGGSAAAPFGPAFPDAPGRWPAPPPGAPFRAETGGEAHRVAPPPGEETSRGTRAALPVAPAGTPAERPRGATPSGAPPASRSGLGGLAHLAERIGAGQELLLEAEEPAPTSPARVPAAGPDAPDESGRGPLAAPQSAGEDAAPDFSGADPEREARRIPAPFGGLASGGAGSRPEGWPSPHDGPAAAAGGWETGEPALDPPRRGRAGASPLPFTRPFGRIPADAEPAAAPEPPAAGAPRRPAREETAEAPAPPKKRLHFGVPILPAGAAREWRPEASAAGASPEGVAPGPDFAGRDPRGAPEVPLPPGVPATGRKGLVADPFAPPASGGETAGAAPLPEPPAPRVEFSHEVAAPAPETDVAEVLEALAREIQHEYRRYYGA